VTSVDGHPVPVLIIGGGPIGLGLAADLGWRGVECLLIEKNDGTIYHPRADTENCRTMEFCRRWGIADKVRAAGTPPDFPRTVIVVTSLAGFEIARIERPTHGGEAPLPYTPERTQRCNQLRFDPILRTLAESFPSVRLRYQCRFDGFVQDHDGVTAEVTDVPSGRRERIRAQYMVACCGGQSRVAKTLGIGFDGVPVLDHNVNIMFCVSELWRYHDKGKCAFNFIMGPEGNWGNVMEVNADDLWRLSVSGFDAPVDPDKIDPHHYIRLALGMDVPYELISVNPWTCRSLVADSYGHGRVFLAGDAAHQHSPAGGLGMNTGLGDAVDLSWKLDAMISGWGGAKLLGSYEAERLPVGRRNVRVATENFFLSRQKFETPIVDIAAATPAGEALRRDLGKAAVERRSQVHIFDGMALGYCYDPSPITWPDGAPPPPEMKSEYVANASIGSRAPHAWLADGRSMLDLFGRGFVLLRLGAAAADTAGLEEAARRRGVPLAVRDIAEPAIGELYARRLVLVRPDGHIAWHDDAPPPDPIAVIDRLRGA
jgi:2-polyprenyl-6-methoxyphenol hydroxylase-like FAD-dependent oxidoreductase